MMAWAKLHDGLDEHAKVERLLEGYGVEGFAAVGLWSLLLTATSRRLEEGRFTRRQLMRLAPDEGERLLELLVEVTLVDVEGDGVWRIHDYLDHNPPAAEVLEKRAKASERARLAAEKRWADHRARIEAEEAARAAAEQASAPAEPDPNQLDLTNDPAAQHAPEHAPGHASAHPDAPGHAAEHAPGDASLAMPRPVPSRPTERETRTRASSGDPLDQLRKLPWDTGSRKWQGAWIDEKSHVVIGLERLQLPPNVAHLKPRVVELVVERILDEVSRWESRGIRYSVFNDFVPAAVRQAERDDFKPQPKPAEAAAQRRGARRDRIARATQQAGGVFGQEATS